MNALLKPDIPLSTCGEKRAWLGLCRPKDDGISAGDVIAQARLLPPNTLLPAAWAGEAVRDPDGTRRKEILVADNSEFRERWAAGSLLSNRPSSSCDIHKSTARLAQVFCV